MITRTQIFTGLGIVLILILCFAGYGLYKARTFLIGPKIFIESPKNGQSVSGSYLEIKGRAKNVSILYLNGRQIFTDKEGNFREGLLLAQGNNIIEIRAKDKFNREVKEIRELVLK